MVRGGFTLLSTLFRCETDCFELFKFCRDIEFFRVVLPCRLSGAQAPRQFASAAWARQWTDNKTDWDRFDELVCERGLEPFDKLVVVLWETLLHRLLAVIRVALQRTEVRESGQVVYSLEDGHDAPARGGKRLLSLLVASIEDLLGVRHASRVSEVYARRGRRIGRSEGGARCGFLPTRPTARSRYRTSLPKIPT